METVNTLIGQPLFWTLIAIGLVIILSGLTVWIYLRKSRRQRELKRVLNQLGNRYLTNVLIPDGLDGQIHIDYLVATSQGVVVLDLLEFEGVIFAGDKLEQWVHVSERKSYRFPNPLHGNAIRCVSVRELAKEIPVVGRVAFYQGASFPKGKPEGVSLLADLADDLAGCSGNKKVLPGQIDSAWEKIREVAEATI